MATIKTPRLRNGTSANLAYAMEIFPNNNYEDVNHLPESKILIIDVDISSILVEKTGESIVMSDSFIGENKGSEYIGSLRGEFVTAGMFEDPILIAYNGRGEYGWIDGQHRATAAHKSGEKKIYAIVITEFINEKNSRN